MKKVLAFICLLSTAAVTHAQVTFSLIDGSDETWVLDSYTNLNNGGWWRTNAGENAYVIFQASEKTNIQGYTITLTSNSKSDGHLPYKWTLYGGNNVGTEEEPEIVWETIHHQEQANNIVEDFDARANINNRAYTFYCNSNKPYEYYKLVITGKSRGSWGCFQISRFDLIPSSVGFSGEGYALDGTTGTKLTGDVSQTIVITPTESTKIKGYQFTTANDTQGYPGRNPKNWTLQGRDSDSEEWTTIDEKTNCSVMEGKNYYPYTFVLANETASYKHYRFVITGVQGGRYLQLSEVALITDLTNCTNGTYEINKEEDLIAFAEIVSGGKTSSNAYLTTDLDMTGKNYTPIGTDANRYKGSFNGQGHSVNLDIDSDEAGQGLFGHVTDGARFSNLIVTGTVRGNGNCAALIGEGRGDHGYIIIRNVGLEAKVTSTGAQNGAFVGNNWGGTIKLDVENSYNIGDVTGASSCLMGGWSNWTGHKFTNVYNIGEISGNDNYKFVYGDDGQATFTNCYTTCTESKADIPGLTQQISTDFIRSGELCAALGAAFTQDLSQEEGHPTFGSKAVSAGKWFNDATDDVYYNLEDGNYTVYQLNLDETNTKYEVPANVTAKNVSITRTIPKDKWIGLCLPFDYDIPSGWEVRELDRVNGTGETASMVFTQVTTTIEAGKPYIVKPNAEVTTITATDKEIATAASTVEEGDVNMIGNFAQTSIPVGSFYINTSSQLKKLNANATSNTLKGFRAHFTVDNLVKALTFDFEDDATGLDAVNGEGFMVNGPIYNLAGQRVNKMQKGINIVNGKKILR